MSTSAVFFGEVRTFDELEKDSCGRLQSFAVSEEEMNHMESVVNQQNDDVEEEPPDTGPDSEALAHTRSTSIIVGGHGRDCT